MSRRLTACVCAAVLLWNAGAQAECNVLRTYAKNQTEEIGTIEIARVDLAMDIHAWYIDCEHTFEVAVDASAQPSSSQRDSLRIQGTFELPRSSVIVGAILWDGDTAVQGRLVSPDGVDSVQRGAHPSMEIRRIKGNGITDAYSLSLFPIKWGWNRKFRVRYLVPQREYHGCMSMPFFPTLNIWSSRTTPPITVGLKSTSLVDSVALRYEGIEDLLKVPATRTISQVVNQGTCYGMDRFSIAVPSRLRTRAATTEFLQGSAYAGNYLLYWGDVPPHLRQLAPRKVEVLFVWKWFHENAYVHLDDQGLRRWGYWDIIGQAEAIRGSVLATADGGAKVGLLHDRDSTINDRSFPLSYRGTLGYENMVTYLQRNANEAYLLSTVKGTAAFGGGTQPEEDIYLSARKGADDFTVCMQKAFSMFSAEDNTVRHIVVVTAGADYEASSVLDFYRNPGFSNLTFDFSGEWNGVPLNTVKSQYALINGKYSGAYQVPEMQGYNYILRFTSGTYSSSQEIIPFYQGDMITVPICQFAGHSQSAWSRSVAWEMYEKNGRLLGSYVDTFTVSSVHSDSALAKIWAGSSEPVSENIDTAKRADIYGIVWGDTYVNTQYGQATPTVDENGNQPRTPYFPSRMIAGERRSQASGTLRSETRGLLELELRRASLLVKLSPHLSSSTINVRVVNLKGQVIVSRSFAAAEVRRGMIEVALHGIAPGMYFCVVSTQSVRLQRAFSIR